MAFQMKNLFSSLYKTAFDILLYTTILAIILALLPNHLFPNLPIEPKAIELNFAEKLENWNNFLVEKSEFLLKGVIVGPESLADRTGFIYTGLSDGRLVEINKKTLKVREVTKFGTKTDCTFDDSECGRVLGTRFHRDQYLYVLDANIGLFRVNVTTGVKEWIDFKNNQLNGVYDDLEFDPKLNVVYISVLTTKWQLNRIMYDFLDSDDSGYMFAYNLDTKQSVKLITGLHLANGLQMTKDNRHLLIAETSGFKILKVSLQTIHKAIKANKQLSDNELETFATLPGEPDNVRLDPNGDVLVGMFSVRNNGKVFFDYLSNWPFVRKAIARTMYSLSVSIDYINSKTFQSISLQTISLDLYTGHMFANYLPKTGAVIKLDAKSGEIKQILGSELFFGVTEALVDTEGDLYFGSFISPFLGRIKKGNH